MLLHCSELPLSRRDNSPHASTLASNAQLATHRLGDLLVRELKAELADRGLDTRGRKAVLQELNVQQVRHSGLYQPKPQKLPRLYHKYQKRSEEYLEKMTHQRKYQNQKGNSISRGRVNKNPRPAYKEYQRLRPTRDPYHRNQ